MENTHALTRVDLNDAYVIVQIAVVVVFTIIESTLYLSCPRDCGCVWSMEAGVSRPLFTFGSGKLVLKAVAKPPVVVKISWVGDLQVLNREFLDRHEDRLC